MSASFEKASRKELRRAIGADALEVLREHEARLTVAGTLISAQTERLGAHDAALDHHTGQLRALAEQIQVLDAEQVLAEQWRGTFATMSWWQRLRWLLRGW